MRTSRDSAKAFLISLALLPGITSGVSPATFESWIDLPFAEGAVALSLKGRRDLDEHLRDMESKGQCAVQWVAVIGSEGPEHQDRASLVPSTKLGDDLKQLLNSRGFPRPIFWPSVDRLGTSLARGSVRLYFVGNRVSRPCTLDGRQ